ncbi:MAG: glycerophosphodiester phosphodiesterase family protein [Phycisphaerae bacterium]|nr:glycerophosphodiester phosphodiesterase family protein [Phycisphaerae bacterium]
MLTRVRKTFLAPLIYAGVLLFGTGLTLAGDAANHGSARSRLNVIHLRTPEELRELFRYTGESMHFVSAHRGGSQAGFPENCIATFENTLKRTFAIMEIDPRFTKDGQIVVHHDPTLDRTTTGRGLVADMTLSQLKELRLKDPDGRVTDFQIPTLDEMLEWARGKTLLVLDQKDVPVEVRVKKIEEHQAEAFAMLIVYSFKDAQTCYALNEDIMMEVMIPNREKVREFDATGVPWSNIIAFTGHTPPEDETLKNMINAKGACCLVGTSRNLDKEFSLLKASGDAPGSVERQYRELLKCTADVIETDLPRQVGELLYGESEIPVSKRQFFRSRQL